MELSKIYNNHPIRFKPREIVKEYTEEYMEVYEFNVTHASDTVKMPLGGCLVTGQLWYDGIIGKPKVWQWKHDSRPLYESLFIPFEDTFESLMADFIYRLIYNCPPKSMHPVCYEHWELVRGYVCDYWEVPIYTSIDYENRWHRWFGTDNCPPDWYYEDKIKSHNLIIPMFKKNRE